MPVYKVFTESIPNLVLGLFPAAGAHMAYVQGKPECAG